jgi:hypothetical protein
MTYLIIIVVFFVLILAFVYFGKKPKIYKKISQKNLKYYLEILLNRGYDRGFIIIRISDDKKPKRIIQFSKYIGESKNVGMQFDFPLAQWSRPYYEKLKILLNENKIDFKIERISDEDVLEFIVIDFKRDLDEAFKLSILVLEELFNLDTNDFVDLWFEGVSEEENKIGF